MSWDEFKSLLSGIAPETPLGRMVAIRSETDKDVMKHFSKDQKRIYNEWRNRKTENTKPETYERDMAYLESMMAALAK